MHALSIVGISVWFALVALLWYAKPSELLWLSGSLALGVVFFLGFFRYVTRPK
jgi:hypothetical protein